MSHQKISWLLSLAAFVLFVLACTIGRYTTKQPPRLQAKPTTNLPGLGVATQPPTTVIPSTAMGRSVMNDFYAVRPELQGRVPKLLEEAIRIKLVSLALASNQTKAAPTTDIESASFVAEIR